MHSECPREAVEVAHHARLRRVLRPWLQLARARDGVERAYDRKLEMYTASARERERERERQVGVRRVLEHVLQKTCVVVLIADAQRRGLGCR